MGSNKKYNQISDIVRSLIDLDTRCELEGVVAEFMIYGGTAVLINLELLSNKAFRATSDIDISIIRTNDSQKLRQLLSETNYHLGGEGVIELPPFEDFKTKENLLKLELEDRLTNINVFVSSIEMVACAKIFSTRQKDLEDLEKTPLLDECDISKVLDMVDDYKYDLLYNSPDLNLNKLEEILTNRGLHPPTNKP